METHTESNGASLVQAPAQTTALAVSSPYGSLTEFVKHMEELKAVAEVLSKSSLLPKAMQNPANLQLVLAQGIEMGFTPIQAIRASFIIESKDQPAKVGYYVESLVALVRKSGVCRFFRVEVMTADECRVVCARKDEDETIIHTFRLSMVEAQKANLDKKWEWEDGKRVAKTKYPWVTAPSDMLRARTCGRAVKAVFQDVIFGMATPDELDAIADAHVIEMMESGADNAFVPAPITSSPAPSRSRAGESGPSLASTRAVTSQPTTKAPVDVPYNETTPFDAPADASTGDPGWDAALVALAKVNGWDVGSTSSWGPDDVKEEFSRRVDGASNRKELNQLGTWQGRFTEQAAKSKTCAEVAAYLRDTFNTRNTQLRDAEKSATAGGAA